MKIELQPFQRQHLKGLAQTLNPVVMIGNQGLTESVLREIAISLDAHELIKIRVLGDDRDARVATRYAGAEDKVLWLQLDSGKLMSQQEFSSADELRAALEKLPVQ